MMLRFYIFVLMFGVAIVRAEDTNAVKDAKAPAAVETESGSFDEFKLITQRNIFDPNRRRPGAPRPAEERPKPVRIDYMNLVGAMSYEKGRIAFFDGSSSEYRKSVKPGDSIAGYKIADVTPSKVTLESGDKKIELPVGGQLKREDEGEWRVNSTPESFASSGSPDSTSSSSTSTTTPASGSSNSSSSVTGSDETNPILKRLLEQRRQGK
ncbi:MAG TPA: hypothetical protein VM680_14680 [Verrucomicrobiae bacterium]|nr:hypothetical protein [Verrucomicrobiae bacterium]